MFFFLKLTADQVLVFGWIMGSCQMNLIKTGQDCLEAGFKATGNPGLTFSSMQIFFAALFCLLIKHKTGGQTIYRKPHR